MAVARPVTTALPLSLRFRSRFLWDNRCRLPALRWMIFPLPVVVKRLLAPLCVFIFMVFSALRLIKDEQSRWLTTCSVLVFGESVGARHGVNF